MGGDQRVCLMLEGERGSGKSAVLKMLAKKCDRELVVLHMGEQIDGKVSK